MNRRTATRMNSREGLDGSSRGVASSQTTDMHNSSDYPTRKPLSPKKSFHSRTSLQSPLTTASIMKLHPNGLGMPNLGVSDGTDDSVSSKGNSSPFVRKPKLVHSGGRRGGSRALNLSGLSPLVLALIAGVSVVLLLFGSYKVFVSYEDKHDAEIRLQIQREEIGPLVDRVEKEKKELQAKLDEEEKELGNLRSRASEQIPLKEQVEILSNYKERMHLAIQRMSRKALREKFGPGPHKVQIQLVCVSWISTSYLSELEAVLLSFCSPVYAPSSPY